MPVMTVFPNPATDIVSFNLQGRHYGNCVATLCSLTGTVLESAFFSNSGRLHLENLAPGTYILSLSSDGILVDRKKVIKL